MSDFDRLVSGMFALFIGIILFLVVLPPILISTGQNAIIAYFIGLACLGVILAGFFRLISE